MKPEEIVELLVDIERRFPVDQWTINGVRIWPLVRVRLYHSLFLHEVSGDPQAAGTARGRVAQVATMLLGAARCVAARLRDWRHEASLAREVDVAFLSDGVSFANLEGAWYEKFCDPIITRIRPESASSCLLVPLDRYLVPRYSRSRFVQPRIDLENVRGALGARKAPRELELSGFAEAMAALATRPLQIPLPTVQTLVRDASRLAHVAAYYANRLGRMRPAAAMVVSYYSLENMAFILACQRLGIPSFDIQHGAAGDSNAAYGMWTRVPHDGYELLPDFFWCWTDADAEAINRWAKPRGGRHQAVVGGHPWLVLWQSGADQAIQRVETRLQEAGLLDGGKRQVLVTLQYGLATSEHLGPVLGAMARSPGNLHWWVRLHPAQLGDREIIRRLLKDTGRGDFELDLATDLPLYAVLKHADVHVTHSSNVVVEAVAFGVPTVFVSGYGARLFPEHMRHGWGMLADTSEGVLQAIDRLEANRASLDREVVPLPNRDKSGLETLVKIVKRRHPMRETGSDDRRR
jgi:hypothetical protein